MKQFMVRFQVVICILFFSILCYAEPVVDDTALSVEAFSEKASALLHPSTLENANWAVLVYNLDSREVVYEENSDKSVMPASNMKIFTTAVALEKLGPDFRFKTNFYIRGNIENGVLNGDLIIEGTGDPCISNRYSPKGSSMEKMRMICREIISKVPIKAIEGKVIADDGTFTDERIDGTWEVSDVPYWYAAETDGLNFNENVAMLHLTGVEGAKPVVKVEPDLGFSALLTLQLLSTERERFDYSRNHLNEFHIKGNMPPGKKGSDRVACMIQQVIFLLQFKSALQSTGKCL